MAVSNPKLLQTLSLLALFLMVANNKVHSQEDHTSFQIDTFPSDPSSRNLIYQGDAHVPSGSSFVRLTRTDSSGNPQRDSVGRVLYSTPVQFWQPGRQLSFETTIQFFIRSPSNNNPANGIAFFIAPVNSSVGASGGSLGIFNSRGTASNVFAVKCDVDLNDPWDRNYRYIGINFNSKDSTAATRANNLLDQVVTTRISYYAKTKMISVVTTAGSQTYSVSYERDLKSVLTQQVQVGISAATGQEVATFDVYKWYFTTELLSDTNSEFEEKYHSIYM